MKIQRKAATADVITEKTVLPAVAYRLTYSLDCKGVLCANVEIALVGADGIRGYCHTFNNSVWIRFHQHPVHKSTGVALITIANQVFVSRVTITDGRPLKMGWETGTSPSTKSCAANLGDNFLRAKLIDTPLQCLESSIAHVFIKVNGIDDAAMLSSDMLLPVEKISYRLVADIYRITCYGFPGLVGKYLIQHYGDSISDFSPGSLWFKVP